MLVCAVGFLAGSRLVSLGIGCVMVCSLQGCTRWVSDWFVFLSFDSYFELVRVDIVLWYKNIVEVVSIRCSFGVGIAHNHKGICNP